MVFIKKSEQKQRRKDYPLYEILTKRLLKGAVGLELEVEGRNIPQALGDPTWMVVRDGSLRGAENAEYVLAKPLPFDKALNAIDSLFDELKTNKAVLDISNRTSVHVHLNVLEFYANRLTALMALWVIFEDMLAHWSGEHRVGNLFCTRVKDTPGVINAIREMLDTDFARCPRENHHYAAMNCHAVAKRGSLEFRTLRGVTSPEPMKLWVKFLQKIYEASDNYKDPRELVEQFSMQGPLQFMDNIFGEMNHEIRKGVNWSDDQVRDSLFEGVRMAQDFIFAKDWSLFNPVTVTPDPFGRKATKAARPDDFAELIERPRVNPITRAPRVAPAPRHHRIEFDAMPDWGLNEE